MAEKNSRDGKEQRDNKKTRDDHYSSSSTVPTCKCEHIVDAFGS